MSRRFLIIDGYNLLHAAGMAKHRYGPGELEKARHRLLDFLARHLGPLERARTTIVFDAGNAPFETSRRSVVEGITVLFAKRGGDADSVIERLIELHSAPRQIHLVSSDHRLQKAARKRRAKSVDSEIFFAELESRGERPPGEEPQRASQTLNDPKFTGDVPQSETDLLMQIFADAGEIDVGDIASGDELSAAPEGKTPESVSSDTGEDEEDERSAEFNDAEWQKYLAEFPENLEDLLQEPDDTR
jgi:predicted RNA-binding protein with PIN domain